MVGLLAAGLMTVAVATGCAPSPASAPASPAGSSSTRDASAAAADYASNTPPAAAEMVCGSDVAGQVAGALGLPAVAAPQSTWADHVYRCVYPLPMGQLILSVTITPSDTAAGDLLQTMRSRLDANISETGLGVPAYGNAAGAVIAAKDNMVLNVDATGLTDDLGSSHARRIEFAQLVAAGVLGCWSGA